MILQPGNPFSAWKPVFDTFSMLANENFWTKSPLSLFSPFLIQEKDPSNANFCLICMSMIWKIFSLIFVDLHKEEKTW